MSPIPKRFEKFIAFLFIFALAIPASAHLATAENFTIQMTDKGFEPREITLTEGDTVTFVNDDSVDRWPASNLHPTHGIYPEFDPQKHIKPGESWTFKFDKPGTWRMHDHLIPRMTGAITVVEDPEVLKEEPSKPSFWSKLKALLDRMIDFL